MHAPCVCLSVLSCLLGHDGDVMMVLNHDAWKLEDSRMHLAESFIGEKVHSAGGSAEGAPQSDNTPWDEGLFRGYAMQQGGTQWERHCKGGTQGGTRASHTGRAVKPGMCGVGEIRWLRAGWASPDVPW